MADETKNTYEELLKLTRTDAELHAQFVNLLEKLHAEHAQVIEEIKKMRGESGVQEKAIRERLERIERIVDAVYLHVSHLAESAIAVLRSDRIALDEIRKEIERKVLEQIEEKGMRVEAGGDVTIGGDVKEERK